LIADATAWIGRLGSFVAPPVVRIALALPFLRSGFTRWDGFLSISPGTDYLFEEQFKLHIFGGLYGFPSRTRWPLSSAWRKSPFRRCFLSASPPGSRR
jgi:hypothetical protein